jgi:fibronectin-binding autotransporter adhesin
LGAGIGGSVVARSGSITLIGDNSNSTLEGLNIGGLTLGADASTAVTTSSTNITLKGNQFGLNSPTSFNTSGTVSVLSLDASNSFGSTQTFGSNWSFGSNVSGLTIGKATNTANLNIATTIGIAGPITMYGGAVVLNAGLSTLSTSFGDVNISTTGLSGTGGIGLAAGRTLTVTQSGSSVYSGLISGVNATFTKLGAGNLGLTNANTYSGGTTLTAGTLGTYHNSALGTGIVNAADGTSLIFGRSVTTFANNMMLSGSATFDLDTTVDYLLVGGGGGGGGGGSPVGFGCAETEVKFLD